MMAKWKEHKLRYAINGNFIFLKVNLSVMSLGSWRDESGWGCRDDVEKMWHGDSKWMLM